MSQYGHGISASVDGRVSMAVACWHHVHRIETDELRVASACLCQPERRERWDIKTQEPQKW